MRTPSVDAADPFAVLLRTTLEQAAQAGGVIFEKVIAVARLAFKERAAKVRGLAERDRLALSLKLLDSHARWLCERYPMALTAAFTQPLPAVGQRSTEGVMAPQDLHFDQLELMDATQVNERVELARSQQFALLAADSALAELDTYICAALGMESVRPECNPLRPEIYVRALQGLLAQTQVPSTVQMEWLQHMSSALGHELSTLYLRLSQQLRLKGVVAAGYAVLRTHSVSGRSAAGSGASASTASESPGSVQRGAASRERDDSVLTLDRLRSLLVGELDRPPAGSAMEAFAAQFSREFESAACAREELPDSDFQATVPAAFEALQEMKQVDRMMERIDQRRQRGGTDAAVVAGSPQEVREHLRRVASGLGQVLSLEVVTLMVENMARDARLLEPIRDIVKSLEPALLRLALVDPRFFSDRQHPARRLLQEITHRSLAYETVDAPGFSDFLRPLQEAVGPLASRQIEDAQAFEQVLHTLILVWDERRQPGALEQAMEALQRAEARHLLADRIARDIEARTDASKIPATVLDFLCGPWAQVVAQARMADCSGSDDPGQYGELVRALVWSAQPELTRKSVGKLTQLVPKLLGKLREGLDLIDYPSTKTSAFFEILMRLHQQAFKSDAQAPEPLRVEGLHPSLLRDADQWIGPAEAKASGFMEMLDGVAPFPSATAGQAVAPSRQAAERPLAALDQAVVAAADFSLPVGAWVEMAVNGTWVRTQLSWASPHGTLFLFTSVYGNTQSMTRRLRDKLLVAGTMRLVSGQPVVDGALDAVVQTAMLNSMDVKV